jgi:hypothetical protein
MVWIKWIASVILFLVFALNAFLNAMNFWRGIRGAKTGSSIPLVGGISGAIALSIVPWPAANRWWWLPLFLDYGCAPLLTFIVFWMLFRKTTKKSDHG